MIAVRLSAVCPDGSVTRVTNGLRNLTHRGSHEQPEPLVPGETYRVEQQRLPVCQPVRYRSHRCDGRTGSRCSPARCCS
jgi:predicted acyl esterase